MGFLVFRLERKRKKRQRPRTKMRNTEIKRQGAGDMAVKKELSRIMLSRQFQAYGEQKLKKKKPTKTVWKINKYSIKNQK